MQGQERCLSCRLGRRNGGTLAHERALGGSRGVGVGSPTTRPFSPAGACGLRFVTSCASTRPSAWRNLHIHFHPLSFDTTGASQWGMESVRFVQRLCHKAALELGVHPSVHFAVWRRRITLAIGRMAAVAIDRHAADVLRTRSGVSRFSGHDPPDFEDLAPVPGATSTD